MTRAPLEPVIKWSGSKRRLVPVLKPLIEGIGFGRYFEPFLGGGSVLGSLGPLPSTASDLQPELIGLWKLIQGQPEALSAQYEIHWSNLQERGHTYYYEVRDHFNATRSPESFLFLTRTCVNGLIRFNTAGNFNNSLHHTRPGIAPERLARIIAQWSGLVSQTDFLTDDYERATATAVSGDLIYLDPPYMANRGRYQKEGFAFDRFWRYLESLNDRGVRWVLSLDGTSGERNYTYGLDAARKLSRTNTMLMAGNSAFPKLLNGRTDAVTESLFTNFEI